MKTIHEFIKENKIKARAVRVGERVGGNQGQWDETARHFVVTLIIPEHYDESNHRVKDARMSIEYSQGSAHTKQPTAADVLDSLAMECSGELESFETFCADYGYDTDSRKADAIFKAVQSNAIRLQKFLTKAAYVDLIGNVERL